MRNTSIKEYKELTKPLEKTVLGDCIKVLREHGYFVMRLNSGMLPIGEGRFRRLVRLLPAGTPDLMGYMQHSCIGNNRTGDPCVHLVFVECKRVGEHSTPLQKTVQEEMAQYGARIIEAHSGEELEAAL